MEQLQLTLVNLISPHCLARDQKPDAVRELARSVSARIPEVRITSIDMQGLYRRHCAAGGNASAAFRSALSETVDAICTISERGSMIVGLSVKWQSKEVAAEVIESVRQRQAENPPLFVIGNIGVTFGYRDLLTLPPFRDTVAVVGEGEDALAEIVRRAASKPHDARNVRLYMDIPNVAVNIDGSVCQLERRVVDLNNYPLAPIEESGVFLGSGDEHGSVPNIETSRGCPWAKCSFCSIQSLFQVGESASGLTQSSWRPFPLDMVLSEIRGLARDRGVRAFDVTDSEFFGPVKAEGAGREDPFEATMQRAEQFARGISAVNADLGLKGRDRLRIGHISARVDSIYRAGEEARNRRSREVFCSLKKAGLDRIYLGIESGSPKQLARYNKGVTVEENARAIQILRSLGFDIEVGFIFFDQRATMEDLRKNVDFIRRTRLHDTDSRVLGSLKVLEGSPLSKNRHVQAIKDPDFLSYLVPYRDEEVYSCAQAFQAWEEATRDLVRHLPLRERVRARKQDLDFVDDLLTACATGRSILPRARKHMDKRRAYLRSIRERELVRDRTSEESLRFAELCNDQLIETIQGYDMVRRRFVRSELTLDARAIQGALAGAA